MKKIETLFKKLSYRQDYHKTMNDLLDAVLHPLCISAPEGYWPTNPIPKYQESKDGDIFIEALQEIGNMAEGFNDPFGDIFMEFISHGRAGQFFTPMDVCRMMTVMIHGENLKEPGKKVLDPACGSGRMLLAMAELNRDLVFNGVDLDDTCCKMAAANMLLNSLVGKIDCGNTITNEYSHVYMTNYDPITKVPFLQIFKYEQKPKEQKRKEITLSTPDNRPDTLVQGSLF